MCLQKTVIILVTLITVCVFAKNTYLDKTEALDSDIFLNSIELLNKYNYSSESHIIKTEDGYRLNIFRIPRKGPPILLVHGIGDSSDSWLVLGPQFSLAYLLADAGFDVWLFNARGNRYSKDNPKKLSKKVFWNFSYEEIGTYDLPATVDYILSVTSWSKLSYIGFSQGTTTFFVLCSIRPEYNEKINHAVLLAPVAWLNNVKHPLLRLFTNSLNELTSFVNKYQLHEAFPFNENFNRYHALVCNILSPLKFLCALEIRLTFGLPKLLNLLPEKLPVITSHIPAGLSTKTFLHYLQGCVSKRFQRYDKGLKYNKIYYDSPVPPEYDVSLITVPMTMFVSEIDWYSTTEDAEILQRKLIAPNKRIVINQSLQFSHLEFIYGARVNSLINFPIISTLKRLVYK